MTKYDTFNTASNVKKKDNLLFKMAKHILAVYIASLLIMIALAIVVTYTGVSEGVISPCLWVTRLLGVFMSAYLTSSLARSRGWLWGVISALIYAGIIYLIGWIAVENYFGEMSFLRSLGISLVVGITGGIAGININKK